jgi:MATE family multidrug resistance protein
MASATGMAGILAEVGGVARLALPMVAGLASVTLLGITDTVIVAPLGPVALAAVGLASAAAVVVYAAVYGLISILGARVGAAHGGRRGREIPFLIVNGLVLGLIAGIIGAGAMAAVWPLLPVLGQPADVLAVLPGYWFWIAATMLPYALLTVFKTALEAVERAWLAFAFAGLSVVLNVPLTWALVHWAGLGVTGAGIGTFAAETLAFLAALAWWRWARSARRLRLPRPLSWTEVRAAGSAGAPMGLMYIAETGAMAVGTAMIGLFGTVALAAAQVANSVGVFLYMVPLGIAGAVTVRVAQAHGAGEGARVRTIAGAALGLSMAWLGVAAALLVAFGDRVAGAITTDPATVALAAQMFLALASFQMLDGLQTTALGALRGLGDTAYPAGVSMLAYWGVALPLGWVLAFPAGMGPAGVWFGVTGALALAAALLVARLIARTRGPGAGGAAPLPVPAE